MRRIWIYAAQRTTNQGRDHPFVACQVMSQRHVVLLGKASCTYTNGPRFEPRTLHNQKKVVFSPGPPIQPQTYTSFHLLQHHFFLSLPRPSLERTVDARGVRRIWIYAAQRTTNHGRDHPFVACHTICLRISPDLDGNRGTRNETLCPERPTKGPWVPRDMSYDMFHDMFVCLSLHDMFHDMFVH
jgi:hypothetical protein